MGAFYYVPFKLLKNLEPLVKAMYRKLEPLFCCGQLWVWHMFYCVGLWWVVPTNKIHRIAFEHPFGFQIDQIHLSIEAHCGTTCLPMGDCHNFMCSLSKECRALLINKCPWCFWITSGARACPYPIYLEIAPTLPLKSTTLNCHIRSQWKVDLWFSYKHAKVALDSSSPYPYFCLRIDSALF